jgi:hypothetical protein
MKYLNAFVTVLLSQLGKGNVRNNSSWTTGRALPVRLHSVGGVFTSRDYVHWILHSRSGGYEEFWDITQCRLVTGNGNMKQDC